MLPPLGSRIREERPLYIPSFPAIRCRSPLEPEQIFVGTLVAVSFKNLEEIYFLFFNLFAIIESRSCSNCHGLSVCKVHGSQIDEVACQRTRKQYGNGEPLSCL
jgi:hypothetical protein